MLAVAVVFGLVAGLLHVGFWVMESVLWRQPRIWKRFGVKSQGDADLMAFGMLNQGYYNLFLGLGAIYAAMDSHFEVLYSGFPRRLLGFCCLFMVGAAVVLFVARRSMLRAALIQGVPPTIALVALVLA